MEKVFSLVYCIIAITLAIDLKAGFLKRNVSTEYIFIQDALGRRFYIYTGIDNFNTNIEKARLNTRA